MPTAELGLCSAEWNQTIFAQHSQWNQAFAQRNGIRLNTVESGLWSTQWNWAQHSQIRPLLNGMELGSTHWNQAFAQRNGIKPLLDQRNRIRLNTWEPGLWSTGLLPDFHPSGQQGGRLLQGCCWKLSASDTEMGTALPGATPTHGHDTSWCHPYPRHVLVPPLPTTRADATPTQV